MKLVVGLGNIGRTYENTYHNVGFACLNQWVGVDLFSINRGLEVLIYKDIVTIYIKPTTLMNHSGRAVLNTMNYYKIPIHELVVIHDDSDISLGEYKIQTNRGSGGHRGVSSIIQVLGSQDFKRIRIGIRAERFHDQKAEEFVLRNISPEDKRKLELVYQSLQDLDDIKES